MTAEERAERTLEQTTEPLGEWRERELRSLARHDGHGGPEAHRDPRRDRPRHPGQEAAMSEGDRVRLTRDAAARHPLIPDGAVLRVSRVRADGLVDCRWPCPGRPAIAADECERWFHPEDLEAIP